MTKPRAGVMIFSESSTREDVYKKRKPIQDREVKKFQERIISDVDLIIPECGEIRSKKDILNSVRYFSCQDVDAIILLIPIFVSSNLVVKAANLLDKPLVLCGNEAPDSISQLGFLVAAGSIEQIDLKYKRIPGDISDEKVKQELLYFLKAATAYKRLKGSTFGCIGGRSLGINTGVADLVTWQKYFGVDIEHIDQFEIVYRANNVDVLEVERYRVWLENNLGKICFNKSSFTPETLDKQIRSYITTKQIIKEYELDFIGIKCQPELSNGYVIQCLNTSLQNDPYDAEGFKEPVVCSCEADSDGALTMQILKLVSGGKPTALQDLIKVGKEEMVLANCGSLPTYFATLSMQPEKNLKEVYMQPNIFGIAGGGTTQFVSAADTFTFARLGRRGNKYWMGILVSETFQKPRKELQNYIWPRPHTFVKVNFDRDNFLQTFTSNHIHLVQGNYVPELIEFCNLSGIEYTLYSEK